MTHLDAPTPDVGGTDLVGALLDAAHHLAGLGLSPGASGNVSIRIGDEVLVSATGTRMADLARDGLSRIDLEGRLIEGARPTKEAPLHLGFYRRSPELRCVIHLHSPSAVALSCLPPHSELSAVPPITPYFVMRVGQTPLLPYAAPGSAELGRHVERLPFPFRAALLQNHGSVCAGETVAAARDSMIELEAAAEIILKLPVGGFRPLSDEQAREVAEAHGSYWGA
jgi:ribulose-5-phosphate 4-epimerase/fuculose-1-phosphate aldolase